jgi:hypothetical protein
MLIIPSTLSAEIVFDSTSTTNVPPGASSTNFSHTVNGSQMILLVGINVAATTVSTVAYNGVQMTVIASQTYTSGQTSLWYLVNPAGGIHDVVVTLVSSAGGIQAGAISLRRVDQTNPIEVSTKTTGSSTTPTASLTTVSDKAWVIDTVGHTIGPTTFTEGADQVERWDRSAINSGGAGSSEGPVSPAGSVTMSWTIGTTGPWGLCAAAVKPAAVTTIPNFFMVF